jgi:hypothetical protein
VGDAISEAVEQTVSLGFTSLRGVDEVLDFWEFFCCVSLEFRFPLLGTVESEAGAEDGAEALGGSSLFDGEEDFTVEGTEPVAFFWVFFGKFPVSCATV